MAYAVTLPPALIVAPIAGAGRLWLYRSLDVATDVDAVGYFTNGDELGMKVGDIVIVTDTDAPNVTTLHRVITATAGGAVTVSTTGLTIT